MAGTGDPLRLRVFLASPGDVGDERAFVHHLLERVLPKDPGLEGRIGFDLVSWDDPHAPTPMPAHLTPQEAVIRFKGRPADCDIVVVILASRIGTHLDLGTFKKPDGSAYVSGTEWEYEDAWGATPRPEILVYRRRDVAPIDPRVPGARARLEQFEQVDRFFTRFQNPDGSWRGGFDSYDGLDQFKTRFEHHIRRLLAERLRGHNPLPGIPAPADLSPDPPPVPLPERCLGRDADSAKLVAALCAGTAPTAVLVQGPGGIGKTTLTQAAANDPDVVARFGPRRWFVELETATDRDTFDAALLTAIGLDPTAGFPAAQRRLAQAPTLLVLDNLDTPWRQAGPAIEARLGALGAIPGVALLASFRGQDAVGGVRWSPRHRVDPLPDAQARALFLDIAGTIAPDDPHLNARGPRCCMRWAACRWRSA